MGLGPTSICSLHLLPMGVPPTSDVVLLLPNGRASTLPVRDFFQWRSSSGFLLSPSNPCRIKGLLHSHSWDQSSLVMPNGLYSTVGFRMLRAHFRIGNTLASC